LRPFCKKLDLFNYRKSTFSSKLHLLRIYCRPFRAWDLRRLEQNLLKTAINNQYDIIIIFKAETIRPEVIFELRKKTKSLIVGWCADSPLEYPNIKDALPAYNSMAMWDTGYLDIIKQHGVDDVFFLPLYAVPEAMSDDLQWPAENPSIGLSFIGTWSEYREKILAPLLPLGLEVWGNGWSGCSAFPKEVSHQPLSYHDMLKTLANSRLTINVHHPQGINDANCRTFEAMGAGAPLIDEPHSDILDMFQPGEHFIPWDKKSENLYDVVANLLENPSDLREMGIRARQEILSKHLLQNRWESFFHHIRFLLDVT
jgi:hypothetical protein